MVVGNTFILIFVSLNQTQLKMNTKNLFTEEEIYYDNVADSIMEVISEVLDSPEVKQMIYQKFRENNLNVILPDVNFSESFGDDMSKIVCDYLNSGSVINNVEYSYKEIGDYLVVDEAT